MANLIDIRRRIRSVKNTQQITRAMKFVSTAKLKRAQIRIFGARPYARRMMQFISHLTAQMPDRDHPLLAERPADGKVLILLITGDKGLCGAFNANLIKAAYSVMAEHPGQSIEFFLVGRKGYDFFGRRDYTLFAHIVDELTRVDMALAHRIVDPLIAYFLEGKADRIYLVYNQFKSVIQQEITVEQVLPITDWPVMGGAEGNQTPEKGAIPENHRQPFLFDQPAEQIYSELFPRHVAVQVYHALLESVASEHGARMTAMDSATRNASEMIDRLVLFRNRVRQAAITKEIIEIVSGAAALE